MKRTILTALLCAASLLLAAEAPLRAQPTAADRPSADKRYRAYLVSNAHFDTQWRWDVQRSISEFLRNTLDQNFSLLEAYPHYLFNFEGAVKYAWAKEYYPERYRRLKAYVARGRWHLAGSTWDAADPIVPSTESLFRNILLGQEFFKAEFGKKATDLFLPDCFGFGHTLPTVAAHCSLIGFSTQKLAWRTHPFHGDSKYPFRIGLWRGVDGAEILAVLDGGGYGWNPSGDLTRNDSLIRRSEESGIGTAYRYYGTRSSERRGDRGGSPLPRTVRSLERSLLCDGPVELIVAASDQLYRDYLPFSAHPELPVYDGELLMDVHGTGCYTAHSELKRFNRRCEQLSAAAERSSVMADHLGVLEYPREALNEEWRRFIWHQFHDDLTGTSIPRAYEFTWNDYLIAQSRFADMTSTATGAVASLLDTQTEGTPVVVYNPAAYRTREVAEAVVTVPEGYEGAAVYGPGGAPVHSQVLAVEGNRMRLIFAADVPSVGYAVYEVRPQKRRGDRSGVLKAAGRSLENRIYRVTLDERGDIVSVSDKRSGRELVGAGSYFGLAAFPENRSDRWPAWEILKQIVDRQPERVGDRAVITVEERGPLRATLRVERRYGDSRIVQRISLTDAAADDRIDVRTEIDWRSPRTLLKAQFPVSFDSPKALYDLGIGTIERGNNTPTQYEVYAQQWAALNAPDGSCGVAVLNDCKYGWDKPADRNLRLTLLHTPTADGGWFPFQRDLDIGRHRFTYSIVSYAHAGGSAQIVRKAEQLNQRLLTFSTSRHPGELGRSYSFVRSLDEGVAVKAVKRAEDGDGYIVRIYETAGSARQTELVFPAPIRSAEAVNGIEERTGPASFAGNRLRVEVGRYAPLTFRVRLVGSGISVPERSQQPLTLPFNASVISSDAFCALGNMDSLWNSYSGELLTRRVVWGGIRFRIGEPDFANAVRCRGQRIDLADGGGKLYLLAASSEGDRDAVFEIDGVRHRVHVPYYSGYYGQWGWASYSSSFLRSARLAHVGTHRHNPSERNEPYVFTYLYLLRLDIPPGARELRLPDDEQVVLFAATRSDDPFTDVDWLTEPRELP